MKENQKILVIDQTIREGMQHRGLMFSLSERKKLLEFQEALGVDISQVAYPPAHSSEMEMVKLLSQECCDKDYKVRIAGHGRAIIDDIKLMANLGIKDFHLHSGVNYKMLKRLGAARVYTSLTHTVKFIKDLSPDYSVKVSLLDIGNTDKALLKKSGRFLANELKVDILALPDTSGIMPPNIFYETINSITGSIAGTETKIAVHCHNDFGMATANTVMGVLAGAKVIEVSAMGIGERNGIGDIFLAGKMLKQQGFKLNLKVEQLEIFDSYYKYLNSLYKQKLGDSLLKYNTPFWGDAVKTHVAGTHGCFDYGIDHKSEFKINVLCGKNLLKKYLVANEILYNEKELEELVKAVKNESATLERSLSKQEITNLAESL